MDTPKAQWAVFFFLNDDGDTLKTLSNINISPQLTIVVQQKQGNHARRWVLGRDAPPAQSIPFTAAKDPAMLTDFLQWGLENIGAEHIALVCIGDKSRANRIEPQYLHQILTETLRNTEYAQFDIAIFGNLISQYIELVYQFSSVVNFWVGAQNNTAAPTLNFGTLMKAWQSQIEADTATGIITAAQTLAQMTAAQSDNFSALNLNALDNLVRALDALTLALMQSLGDDIIWDALWHADSETLFPFLPPPSKLGKSNLDLAVWLESLAQALTSATQNAIPQWLAKKLKKSSPKWQRELRRIAKNVSNSPAALENRLNENLAQLPETLANDFRITQSQQSRAENLADLAEHALALLSPAPDGLIFATPKNNPFAKGLSIHLPPNLDRLSQSQYLNLAFNRHIHWTALLSTVNLIAHHPRALWRLSSSLLTTAGADARADLLRRLIGPDSVMVGYRAQFSALASHAKLSLTLEPHATASNMTAQNYRLRLESPETGATILEQNSRVNPQSINAALDGLKDLLADGWVSVNQLRYLELLGRTLGEDIIQNLADNLNTEYRRLNWLNQGNSVPHLQLQLPRELMQYPWELLHDGYGLLCERYALGRKIFTPAQFSKPKSPRPEGGIRVLIIGDPLFNADFLEQARIAGKVWAQLPGAREEAEQVAQSFEQFADIFGNTINFQRGVDTRIHQKITRLEFRDMLRKGRYDIIHFAGHALFNPENPEQSAWLFSDGALWAQEIRNTLARVKNPPWLVYANACEAAMSADNLRKAQYQGDVFGLATAFINQGVAAYIAPLWDINDSLAAQMAIDFYHALLLNTASLGEALYFARQMAKQQIFGNGKSLVTNLSPMPAKIGMGWASLVLYGDPTARLQEKLWTPHHLGGHKISATLPNRNSTPRKPLVNRPLRPMQASDEETLAAVSGPGMIALPVDGTRGLNTLADNETLLELVEINGIRHWQSVNRDTGEQKVLPKSTVAAVSRLPETRQALNLNRGAKDYIRTIGRWIFQRGAGGLFANLGEQYDRETVPEEKLWRINRDGSLASIGDGAWLWLDDNTDRETDRVLLILHGTFSRLAFPARALGGEFLTWASRRYRGIIGYDHWTLSKSPLENARNLWEMLDNRLKTGNKRIDIIAHSRGGLIARTLVELEGHAAAINQVMFVATPNSGSSWLDPLNWGNAADHLVNMLHLDNFGFYGKLSGLMARLAINESHLENLAKAVATQLPGVQAQNPRATGPDDFLGKLQRGKGPPDGVRYAGVAANYEPARDTITLKKLFKFRKAKFTDNVTDNFLSSYNDLVVDTAHVWAVDAHFETDNTETMPWLPAQNLLVFNPGQKMKIPAGAISLNVPNVHHTNILYYRQTRNFLREQLLRDTTA